MVDQLHILDTITMAPWVDHPHQDSNQTTQTTLEPTPVMVSTVITLTDTSTQEARQLPAQEEVSGLEWEQAGCLDIFLVVRGASPTILTTPLTLTDLPENLPLPGHALLQVLEEPKEDRSPLTHTFSAVDKI